MVCHQSDLSPEWSVNWSDLSPEWSVTSSGLSPAVVSHQGWSVTRSRLSPGWSLRIASHQRLKAPPANPTDEQNGKTIFNVSSCAANINAEQAGVLNVGSIFCFTVAYAMHTRFTDLRQL